MQGKINIIDLEKAKKAIENESIEVDYKKIKDNNFSLNYNTYTGSTGSRARDYSSSAYNYGSGHTIHTGSRGGQYYINSNGNKTYVPKR